jgi:hypothetical protein
MVGQRSAGMELEPYCWPDASFSLPHAYEPKEMLS